MRRGIRISSFLFFASASLRVLRGDSSPFLVVGRAQRGSAGQSVRAGHSAERRSLASGASATICLTKSFDCSERARRGLRIRGDWAGVELAGMMDRPGSTSSRSLACTKANSAGLRRDNSAMISALLIAQMIAWKRSRRPHLHASPDHGNPFVSEKAPSSINSASCDLARGFDVILGPARKSRKYGRTARFKSLLHSSA